MHSILIIRQLLLLIPSILRRRVAVLSRGLGPGTSPWKPFDSRIVFNDGVDYGYAKTYGMAIHFSSLKDKVIGLHLSKEGVKVIVNGDIVESCTGREGLTLNYFACFLGKDNSLYTRT